MGYLNETIISFREFMLWGADIGKCGKKDEQSGED